MVEEGGFKGEDSCYDWHFSPAMDQDGYIRDPGIPDMVQHADQ